MFPQADAMMQITEGLGTEYHGNIIALLRIDCTNHLVYEYQGVR